MKRSSSGASSIVSKLAADGSIFSEVAAGGSIYASSPRVSSIHSKVVTDELDLSDDTRCGGA
jgi:hypothetical protein